MYIHHKSNDDFLRAYTGTESRLHLSLVSGLFFASSVLHAETQAVISPQTLQTEIAEELPLHLNNNQQPDIEILENDGVYQISIKAVINAPERLVRHVLTDFVHIYRLNPSIIESDVVKKHSDGAVSVRTKVIGCAAYFCEELERVEKVHILPSGDLLAEIVPEMSQFKSGQTLWHINALAEDQCEVIYTADMEPDVFIPPIIGKLMIKQSMREEMKTSFANLEKISLVLEEKEWQINYQPELTVFASDWPCTNYASHFTVQSH